MQTPDPDGASTISQNSAGSITVFNSISTKFHAIYRSINSTLRKGFLKPAVKRSSSFNFLRRQPSGIRPSPARISHHKGPARSDKSSSGPAATTPLPSSLADQQRLQTFSLRPDLSQARTQKKQTAPLPLFHTPSRDGHEISQTPMSEPGAAPEPSLVKDRQASARLRALERKIDWLLNQQLSSIDYGSKSSWKDGEIPERSADPFQRVEAKISHLVPSSSAPEQEWGTPLSCTPPEPDGVGLGLELHRSDQASQLQPTTIPPPPPLPPPNFALKHKLVSPPIVRLGSAKKPCNPATPPAVMRNLLAEMKGVVLKKVTVTTETRSTTRKALKSPPPVTHHDHIVKALKKKFARRQLVGGDEDTEVEIGSEWEDFSP
ncbi:hypothetical protein HDV03_002364, partial [Kappamyces sp. JEL0829]